MMCYRVDLFNMASIVQYECQPMLPTCYILINRNSEAKWRQVLLDGSSRQTLKYFNAAAF